MEAFFSGSGEPQGAYSWQHLSFATAVMVAMVFLAVFFGKRYRRASYKQKNKVLIAAAIIIDSFETAKVIIACILEGSAEPVGRMLPLFLCGIQLVAIPVAAFSRGDSNMPPLTSF